MNLCKHLSYNLSILLMTFLFLALFTGCAKQEKAEDKAPILVFPELEGWKLGEIATYKGEELYGPIDGEAERYMYYGFKEAFFASYKDKDDNGIIDVQIYRMDKSDSAYGIFSMYDSPNVKHHVLPEEMALSALSDGALDLMKGEFFIRISQHQMDADPELLKLVGKSVAGNLEGETRLPDILSLLPEGYVEGSIRYFRKWETYREINFELFENALNLSGETEGIQTIYTITEDGIEKDKLLIVKYPDEADAKGTFSKFVRFFIDEGFEAVEQEKGPVLISRQGNPYAKFSLRSNYIYGFLDISSEEKAKELMDQTLAKLER